MDVVPYLVSKHSELRYSILRSSQMEGILIFKISLLNIRHSAILIQKDLKPFEKLRSLIQRIDIRVDQTSFLRRNSLFE